MNISAIEPRQAWQMALEQLRPELSQAYFNTWVRDTEFISFADGVVTVGTANSYAREWLANRLTNIVSRLLSGILELPISVNFVVHEGQAPQEDEKDEEDSNRDETLEADGPTEEITLQVEYQSIYDEIVQPDQVIVVPGYFLRFIPLLGLELSWLYIGFRQAAYEAGASKKPGKKVGAPAKKVAWYAGISPRTFWRWAAKPNTWKQLRWLVKPVEEQPHWSRGSDGRPHQAIRYYKVAMTMPLTPFDELSLRAWLYRRLAEGKSPLVTLRAALETPVDELLPWPEKMPSMAEIGGEPHSIQDVVFEVCSPIAQSDQAQFNDLADKLSQHLMPSKDLVFLTHYFVSRWLARLGPGPGWFVTLLRDRCYLNQRTGEIRDEVRLEEGYAEAARWLGLKRVKTIWEWLRNEDVATFIRETGRENGGWEDAPRRIKVNLGEPMLDDDQNRAKLALANRPVGASVSHRVCVDINPIGASDSHSIIADMAPIGASVTHSELSGEAAIGASVTHREEVPGNPVGASDSHSGATVTHRRGASVTDIGASVTDIGATDSHRIGASVTIDWRDCHSLNSLTPGLKHLKNIQTTPSENGKIGLDGASPEMKKPVVVGEWKLSEMLALNRIGAKNQELLLAKGVSAQAFISWLIYAASVSGNGIRDPLGHAVSRLIQDPTRGAGGASERLAGLPPKRLAELIFRELDFQNPPDTDWRTVMEGVKHTRIRVLAEQLGVPVPDSNYG